ncbi:MAG: tyrosine--tRNA ligase [Planctomycetes bacterium]|nr:tyrosine--tRNA ligase [Planctomycetota bacterium]
MPSTPHEFLSELRWRGLLHQSTDEAALVAHLTGTPRKVYVGFDPTADSLTIGNLVPIMLLAHVQRAGHIPIVVSGGGTGLIGDPSGKSAERTLMTKDTVLHNCRSQMRIFGKILDFDSAKPNHATLVNNIDWLGTISYLDALRDIGKHFSVNQMVQRDAVKDRLNNRDQGISYTEFSYILLQAYDFHHLYKSMGVTVQLGGSDQFGNIISGIDLIKKSAAADARASGSDGAALEAHMANVHAFGATAPLVTKSDGTKFGKTESGAIWLTADRTSPFAYYQFWLNSADADALKWIRIFTFLTQSEVQALEAQHAANPGERPVQRALAREATRILHGTQEMETAEAAGKALFSGEVASLPPQTFRDVLSTVPTSAQPLTSLSPALSATDLLINTKLASSKREAREFLTAGSVTVNGRKLGPDDSLTTADLLHTDSLAIRRGKKNWHWARFS